MSNVSIPTQIVSENKETIMQLRQGYLMQVDALERALCMSPTTAEIREMWKKSKFHLTDQSPSTSDDISV